MTKLFTKLCSKFLNCNLCRTLWGCRGSCIKDFKCKKLVKIRTLIIFSTLITKLAVEEDTVVYKETKQMSHEGILEILGHVETGKLRKTLENLWIPTAMAPALAQQMFNWWQND